MAQRKILTDRQPEADTLLVMMQREIIPYVKQTGKLVEGLAPTLPATVTGSRGGATAFVLSQILTALAKAGVLVDSSTP